MSAGIAASFVNTFVTTLTSTDGVMASLALSTGPGPNGTSNPAGVTTREAVAWNTVSGGATTASTLPVWSDWPAGSSGETITFLAFWDSTGNTTFGMSMQLNPSVTMNTGDTLSVTSLSVSLASAIAS